MYPDQIKHYTTEEQFLSHRQLLADLERYFSNLGPEGNAFLRNIEEEKRQLERIYRNWKRRKDQQKAP